MLKIGFIGTGVMGQSLVRHLLQNKYQVYVYNRTKSKALPLIDEGAFWLDDSKAIAVNCDVIMTMLGYPQDVEDIYFNYVYGLLDHAKKNTLLIDLTTSTPSLAIKIAKAAQEKGLMALDAPVSGGDSGAKNGSLTIMCGGTPETYAMALPYLKCFGNNILLQGEAGSGQHTKMCNQIAIASGIMGVCEAIKYAKSANLNVEQVLASISKGAAGSWQLTNNGQKMIDNDYQPGFYIKHFIKDMRIAIDEARLMKINLPGLTLAEKLYEEVAANGNENLGTQALIYWYNN